MPQDVAKKNHAEKTEEDDADGLKNIDEDRTVKTAAGGDLKEKASFVVEDCRDIEKTEEKSIFVVEDRREDTQFAVPALPTTKNEAKKTNTSSEKKNENQSKNIVGQKNLPKGKEKSGFPYTPPLWGGVPPAENKYSLTVLKEGIVRDTLDLTGKSTMTFGRHPTACDVSIEHPSCSRYHAVLQYCTEEKEVRKVGFYLYDMGSTHGCYVNKERMKPKVYVRVRVGYQIKFGGSSRLYIMEGPSEDQEEEGDIEEVRAVQEKRKQQKKQLTEKEEDVKDGDGASWGFAEDAQEEELDLKALMEKKKSIEVKDPKKTLKGFFEREGLDFEYEMSERGRGTNVVHVARVHLPIESSLGEEIVAEGTSSNKKDAVLNCAMDACKIIQAYDVMQNPLREGEREKRQRELEANDFYDSDDDNYLDRTGAIEKKRAKRKQFAGKKDDVEGEVVYTHESLKKEMAEKRKELTRLERKLNLAKESGDGDDEDSLDAFMSNIANKLEKKEELKLKRQIAEMRKEVERIQKLVDKTSPALPELKTTSAIIPSTKMTAVPEDKLVDTTCTLEADKIKKTSVKHSSTNENTLCTEDNNDPCPPDKKKKKKNLPQKPTGARPETKPKPTGARDKSEEEKEKEVTQWEPPVGQTGDGRTHLNDKFGY